MTMPKLPEPLPNESSDLEPAGKHHRTRLLTRQCIVSREILPTEEMIRFVASPDGVITPDLAEKLPGRGMWVKADVASVASAAAQRAFSRAAKAQLRVPEGLVPILRGMLEARALDALAMTRKAGLLVFGYEKVRQCLEKNEAIALLHALDAGADGAESLNAKARGIPVYQCFSREALGRVIGRDQSVHLVLKDGGASVFFMHQARRFTGFC